MVNDRMVPTKLDHMGGVMFLWRTCSPCGLINKPNIDTYLFILSSVGDLSFCMDGSQLIVPCTHSL